MGLDRAPIEFQKLFFLRPPSLDLVHQGGWCLVRFPNLLLLVICESENLTRWCLPGKGRGTNIKFEVKLDGSYIAAACFDDGNIVQWTMPMLMLLTMITPVLLMLESLQFNRVTANSEASCSPYAAATVLKTIVFMFLFGIFVFLYFCYVFVYFCISLCLMQPLS